MSLVKWLALYSMIALLDKNAFIVPSLNQLTGPQWLPDKLYQGGNRRNIALCRREMNI